MRYNGINIFAILASPMTIEIYPYDPTWPDLFLQTARPLRDALGEVALRLDHIGSTSIPGTAAKPIIDIQISVAAFEPFDRILQPMESLGYIWRADNPELTKRYFREPTGTRRTHIHVRVAGSWSEQFALLFRDYMRHHPADAAAYVELKQHLATQYQDNREAYTDAKTPFIWTIMQKADVWSQNIGWQPGPSDI